MYYNCNYNINPCKPDINEKLKKEIIHYKNLYENSMGISSISVSNSQNLNKKIKSKRTFSDNNKNNINNNNNYIVNNATINVNKNEYNLYEKPQKTGKK